MIELPPLPFLYDSLVVAEDFCLILQTPYIFCNKALPLFQKVHCLYITTPFLLLRFFNERTRGILLFIHCTKSSAQLVTPSTLYIYNGQKRISFPKFRHFLYFYCIFFDYPYTIPFSTVLSSTNSFLYL